MGESDECGLHRAQDEAGDRQCDKPVMEVELEGRVVLVVLVGQQKFEQVDEGKDW